MARQATRFVCAIFAATLIGFWVAHFGDGNKSATTKETVLERVLRTNTLRCGYYNFPPMFVMYNDKGEKAPQGFSFDMMASIGQKTGLKIDWAEEITFGNWPQALQTGRIDAVCTPVWPDAPLGRAARFTKPMFYSTLSPLVRVDDARFKNDVARLDQPDVTFMVQDGNNLVELTKQMFPHAKYLSVAANLDGSGTVENIITKKADAALLDRNAMLEYNKHNGNKLRMVAPDKPVKYQPFVLAVSRTEPDLQEFLNNAQDDLHYNRALEGAIRKWEAEPGLFVFKVE